MTMTDANSNTPPAEWTEKAHLASLEAFRSATLLRRAKAALLFSVSGAIAFAVIVPLCLDRPRTWFGVEFGPVPSADARVSIMEKQSRVAAELDLVSEELQRRVELIDRRLDRIERRCLIDGRPITIAPDTSSVLASVPSRVALLQIEPTALNEYRAVTSFAERWIYPDDLEKPYVILRGTPADTTDLHFQLTWIGGDGATIGRATAVFTKTAGKWDKLVQVARCAEIDPESEKLGRFRIQISQ